MKNKLLLMLFALTISISAFSEPLWLKAVGFSYKQDGRYLPWTYSNIDVCLDLDRNQVIVYSKDAQVFDYVEAEFTEQNGYKMLQARCTDTQYRKCVLSIITGNNSITLYVDYQDIEYKYKLE